MSTPLRATLREHLEFCKVRALVYIDRGDIDLAYASLMSDLGKHPETNTPEYAIVMRVGLGAVLANDIGELRRFIEGL